MKIVLLSISIGILGYCALLAMPDRRDAPSLASSSYDDAEPTPARHARVNRTYRH